MQSGQEEIVVAITEKSLKARDGAKGSTKLEGFCSKPSVCARVCFVD